MTMQVRYRPEQMGDWGAPAPAEGGRYATDTLAMRDGTRLFLRFWHAADPQAPVLLLLHGLGAHSGWFIDMGNALNQRGLTVYAVDHRGFGRSEGPRGHVAQGMTYIHDLDATLDEVRRRRPGAPVAVLGHSMGGIFALHLAAADARSGRNALAGMVLLNPWIADTTKVGLGATLGLVFDGIRGSTRPFQGAGGPANMTTNPEAVTMLDADSYWVRAESAAFLYQITLMRQAALRRAREVRSPALVLQADADRAVVPAASLKCFEALGSPQKLWKTYPGYAHDSELEADRTALDDDIAHWLIGVVTQPGALSNG